MRRTIDAVSGRLSAFGKVDAMLRRRKARALAVAAFAVAVVADTWFLHVVEAPSRAAVVAGLVVAVAAPIVTYLVLSRRPPREPEPHPSPRRRR